MLFSLHGRRTAKIKTHTNTQDQCRNCKSLDLDIKVYRDYYHFALIPIIPVGDKIAKIYCNKCGDGLRIESVRQSYEKATRTPFYLYAVPIIVVLGIAAIFLVLLYKQTQYSKFIADPRAGDVYKVQGDRNGLTIYYFMRVSRVKDDSVFVLENNLHYLEEVDKFDERDFFTKDEETGFSMKDLKEMLDGDAIQSVERGYRDDEGFNRMQ